MPCECCNEPPCYVPTIEWESKSASLSKCGFSKPGEAGKRYFKRVMRTIKSGSLPPYDVTNDDFCTRFETTEDEDYYFIAYLGQGSPQCYNTGLPYYPVFGGPQQGTIHQRVTGGPVAVPIGSNENGLLIGTTGDTFVFKEYSDACTTEVFSSPTGFDVIIACVGAEDPDEEETATDGRISVTVRSAFSSTPDTQEFTMLWSEWVSSGHVFSFPTYANFLVTLAFYSSGWEVPTNCKRLGGSATVTRTDTDTYSLNQNFQCVLGTPTCVGSATGGVTYTGNPQPPNRCPDDCTVSGDPCRGTVDTCGIALGQAPPVVTYENEYLTSSLISNTVASLPDSWPGTGVGSYRNLSPTELTYSLRRARYRLKHAPAATCFLKVWLRTKFTPEGAGSPTYGSPFIYTWEPSSNPCLTDPSKSISDDDNEITGGITAIDEPAENGTTIVEIVKWSCLPDYTPPDDGTANGFPV